VEEWTPHLKDTSKRKLMVAKINEKKGNLLLGRVGRPKKQYESVKLPGKDNIPSGLK